jgi:hypothetical protein
MKIIELVFKNVENIIVLQNTYKEQQDISIAIRGQLTKLTKLKPKQFTTSYKNYPQIKNEVEQIRDEFNMLIDTYLENINKLSLPTKQIWLQDFANLKI